MEVNIIKKLTANRSTSLVFGLLILTAIAVTAVGAWFVLRKRSLKSNDPKIKGKQIAPVTIPIPESEEDPPQVPSVPGLGIEEEVKPIQGQGSEETDNVQNEVTKKQGSEGVIGNTSKPTNVEYRDGGIDVQQENLDFGEIPLFRTATTSLIITSTGGVGSAVGVECKGDCEQFERDIISTFLQPNEERTLNISFTPNRAKSYSASLIITIAGQRATLTLTGIGLPIEDVTIEVLVDDGTLFSEEDGGYSDPVYHKIMELFYKNHKDVYDFITIFDDKTSGPTDYHSNAQFKVSGIGTGGVFDQSGDYGSQGRILGFNFVGSIDDVDPSQDGVYNKIVHETGHQWMLYLSDSGLYKVMNPISPPHWTPYLDFGNDPMSGNCNWRDNKDGTFTCIRNTDPLEFSWLSLYLLGLAEPDEVPTYLLVEHEEEMEKDQLIWDYTKDTEGKVEGKASYISVQDFISEFGARTPSYSESQKDFTMAFILILRTKQELPNEELQKLKTIAETFPEHWNRVTRGRSTMNEVDIEPVFD